MRTFHAIYIGLGILFLFGALLHWLAGGPGEFGTTDLDLAFRQIHRTKMFVLFGFGTVFCVSGSVNYRAAKK